MHKIPDIKISDLLDAGVHFGHKASKWNPKMAPYIYGEKNGLHIIDLRQTVILMKIAMQKAYNVVKNNGKILFVSTKHYATEFIEEYASKSGQHYVNHRWLGGMLTNWNTVSKSIKTLTDLEKILSDEVLMASYVKKERLEISRKKDKLFKSLNGIRDLSGRPDLMIVIDTNKEHLAIQEARKLNIPVIGIVDSNSNPYLAYPVPGNDDSIRAIRFYCEMFSNAILAGLEEALIKSGADLESISNGIEIENRKELKAQENIKKLDKKSRADIGSAVKKQVNEDKVSSMQFAKSVNQRPLVDDKDSNKNAKPTKTSTSTSKAAAATLEELNQLTQDGFATGKPKDRGNDSKEKSL